MQRRPGDLETHEERRQKAVWASPLASGGGGKGLGTDAGGPALYPEQPHATPNPV